MAPQDQTAPVHVCYPGLQSSQDPVLVVFLMPSPRIIFSSVQSAWNNMRSLLWLRVVFFSFAVRVCAGVVWVGAAAARFGLVTWRTTSGKEKQPWTGCPKGEKGAWLFPELQVGFVFCEWSEGKNLGVKWGAEVAGFCFAAAELDKGIHQLYNICHIELE